MWIICRIGITKIEDYRKIISDSSDRIENR